MLPHDTRIEIENIVARAILKRSNDSCTTIRNSICNSFATSTVVKRISKVTQLSKKSKVNL